MEEVVLDINKCCKCDICKNITNKVPWEWSWKSGLFFVWEAPWKQEDLSWRPFVGPAWKVLDYMIENILKIKRSDVFITSVLKCRPPGNRDPKLEEIENCWPFLEKQIKCLDPKIVVALWRFAAWTLIWKIFSITKMRWKLFTETKIKRPVFVVFHPAAVIYNPKWRKDFEEDFKKLKNLLWLRN